MTPQNHSSIKVDDIVDVALHDEIKCRAYELYERRHDAVESHDLKAELRRVAYAAAQLQKYANGEVGDTRAVKAARVYLCALSAFISERNWIDQETTTHPGILNRDLMDHEIAAPGS